MPVPRGLSASVCRSAVTPLLRSRPLSFVVRSPATYTRRTVATNPGPVPAAYAERFPSRGIVTPSETPLKLGVGFPKHQFLDPLHAPDGSWVLQWRKRLLGNITRILKKLPLEVSRADGPVASSVEYRYMVVVPDSKMPVFRAVREVQSMVHLLARPSDDPEVSVEDCLTWTEILVIKNVLALPSLENDATYALFHPENLNPRRVSRETALSAIQDLLAEPPQSNTGKELWALLKCVLIRRIGTHANEEAILSNIARIVGTPIADDPRHDQFDLERPPGYPRLVLPRVSAIDQVLKDSEQLTLWVREGLYQLKRIRGSEGTPAPQVAPAIKHHIPHVWRPVLSNVQAPLNRRRIPRSVLEKVVQTTVLPDDTPPDGPNLSLNWKGVSGIWEKKFGPLTQKRAFSSSTRILSIKCNPTLDGLIGYENAEGAETVEAAELINSAEDENDLSPRWTGRHIDKYGLTAPRDGTQRVVLQGPSADFTTPWRERLLTNISRILEASAKDTHVNMTNLTTKGRGIESKPILAAIHEVQTLIHLLAEPRSWEPDVKIGKGPFLSNSAIVATKNVLELLACNFEYYNGSKPAHLRLYDHIDEPPRKISPIFLFHQLGRLVEAVPWDSPIAPHLKVGIQRCFVDDIRHPLNRLRLAHMFLQSTPAVPRMLQSSNDEVPFPREVLGYTTMLSRRDAIKKILRWSSSHLSTIREEMSTTFGVSVRAPEKFVAPPKYQMWKSQTSSIPAAKWEARKVKLKAIRDTKQARRFSIYSRMSADMGMYKPLLPQNEPPKPKMNSPTSTVGGVPKTRIRAQMEENERGYLEELEHAIRQDQTPPGAGAVELNPGEDALGYDDAYGALTSDPGEIVNFSGYQRLAKGDMCELRVSGGTPNMAIFIRNTPGERGNTSDFLTYDGKIIRYHDARVPFTLPGFIPEDVIEAFLKLLEPMEKFYAEKQVTAWDGTFTNVVVPKHMSDPLVTSMQEFRRKAGNLRSKHSAELGKLWQQLASEDEMRLLTTQEAAEMVFGEDYTDEHLYATHLFLMADGLRYIGDKGFHRFTQKFEIRSKQDLAMIDSVTEWLRMASLGEKEKKAKGPAAFFFKMKANIPLALASFVEKCRFIIDFSRKNRVTFEDGNAPCVPVELKDMEWTHSDRLFINYMKSRLESYGLQPTPIEGLAPFILRLTERYPGSLLDANTVYQFLGEIGARAPWESTLLERHHLRLPHYGGMPEADAEEARYQEANKKSLEELGLTDQLAGIRKDWGNMAVYAVDDITAHEIDDGVSIERVNDNETWVHVHIANPGGYLTHDHWISKCAEKRSTTKYLDPFVFPMLPGNLGDALGIRPGGPVLTVSTKVDKDGEILDCMVQAGTVHNVKRVTYNQMHDLLELPEPARTYTMHVGAPFAIRPDPPLHLTPDDVSNLKFLETVAHSLIRRRARHGAVDLRNAVYFPHVDHSIVVQRGSSYSSPKFPIIYKDHPSVSIDVYPVLTPRDANEIIAECMILAGSTVALYASKHSIPVPYRVLELNRERSEVLDHFQNVILPSRDEFGVTGRVNQDLPFFLMLATGSMKSVAAAQSLMGLPTGYVKATSPLRRYTDLMVHWNLQAHLLGKPLPFSNARLEAEMPGVDLAERMANFASKQTASMWHASAVQRILETGQQLPWPEVLEVVMTQPKTHPSPSVGFARELASRVKVVFKDMNQWRRANELGTMLVKVKEVKMGERMVWTECVGVGGNG